MSIQTASQGAEVLFENEAAAMADARTTFQAQRAAFKAAPFRSAAERKADLGKLLRLVRHNRFAICEAISEDFGNRATNETRLTEILGSINTIKLLRRKLKSWMRPQRRATSIWYLPGSNKCVHQPLGVVGVMSPWNYPIHLTIAPLATALAAGNRVMIKMSELTPTVTALMKRLLTEAFGTEQVAVIDGDATVAKMFASLPFNHLLFTGSSAVGRQVMAAAAENLTPVTLELSGKCPAIVDGGYPLKRAVDRIVWGKLFSAGQSCVAPDYALIPKGTSDAFADAALAIARKLYPSITENAQYTSIIDEQKYRRLSVLVEDARKKGARIIEAWDEPDAAAARKFPLTLVLNPTPDMKLMQEEVFGPILPVVEYDGLDEAIDFVNDRPSPLAMYLFSNNGAHKKALLARTSAGGMTLNDTLYHYLQDSLPFGGVGASGMGQYHGREGFETFSHRKPVFSQRGFGSFTGAKLLYPPYGKIADLMIGIMSR